MGLTDIVINTISVIIGGVIGVFTTKWSMSRQKKDQTDNEAILASKEILGTAAQIVETLRLVKEQSSLLSDIDKAIKEEKALTEEFTIHDSLSFNIQLDLRTKQKESEKRVLGKYILKHISSNSCLAIDCGTSTAWSFFEIAQVHKNTLKVFTNNTFIPSLFSQEYDYNQYANFWGVKEVPSMCYITAGYYFPSYGGILKTEDDSIVYYKSIWETYKPDTILMGCTSLTIREGPYARSGANMRFKESLMAYVLENRNTQLFILLDIDKISKRIGEPSSQNIWEKLVDRDNVFILVGYSGNISDYNSQVPYDINALIAEEVRLMFQQNRMNRFYVIDKDTNKIDIKKYYKDSSMH